MSRRLLGIDGVRGIAAAMVVLYHVWLYTPPFTFSGQRNGVIDWIVRYFWLGVTIFFVLSGFLLFRPFAAAIISKSKPPRLRSYVAARALRIVPAYYLALTVVILTLHRHLFAGPPWQWAKDYLFLQIYFPRTTEVVIGPAWTLCIEVTFYAALPLLAWVIGRFAAGGSSERQRARRQILVLLVLIAAGIAYRGAVLAFPGVLPIALPEFIDLFAIGMALAVVLEYRRTVGARALAPAGARLLWLAAAATAAAATLVAHRFSLPRPGDSLRSALFDPLVGATVACLLATMVLTERSVLTRICSRPLLASLGAISYGLYLWHEPLLTVGYNLFEFIPLRWQLLQVATVTRYGFSWATPLAVAVALIAASVSWRRFEQPLLRLRSTR